jgi:myosin heavy subunit
VFYQLLAGASPEQRDRLRLRRPSEGGYAYLQGEQRCIHGVDDKAAFARLQHSMSGVGMSAAEQEQVFRLLSATLLLGEVDFEDHGLDQRATIATPEALNVNQSLLAFSCAWRPAAKGSQDH